MLGLGNILLKDDGIGVHILNRLREKRMPKGIDLVDGGTAGMDAVYGMGRIDNLIIVDAVRCGKRPGTLYRLRAEYFASAPCEALSLHQIGVYETLSIMKRQGTLPPNVVILGIEPKDITWGLSLSDSLQKKLDSLVASVRRHCTETARKREEKTLSCS